MTHARSRFGVHPPLPASSRARMDQLLDEALAASFPASDPINLASPLAAISSHADMLAVRQACKGGL